MADTLPPLSLYIHTPWCVRKCPYCDFNSHEPGTHGFTPRDLPEAAYLYALLQDLDSDLDLAAGREIKTIFIGGGTPSLLSPAFYERLLKEIRIRLPFSKEIEITLEANPGTTEQERFIGYRKAGINRLSLGIQSFQPDQLHALGRIHSGDEAITAVAQARQAGFTNINIDLMHGLPDQTPQLAMDDIAQALALAPEHLSWYQLTLEPNTAFHSHPPVLPEEEALWDIQDKGHQLLEQAGFKRYEISAYASAGHQSRHNLNYWQFGDYLGIGAGAHGKLSRIDSNGEWHIERRWKTRQPDAYLKRVDDLRGFIAGKQLIKTDELPLEFAMNALRLTDGVSLETWRANTGEAPARLLTRLQSAEKKGLLMQMPEKLRASPQGLLFLNELLALISDD
ncbi:radical SAM family heme chaperone HemW [Vreelandella titanicae]|jgi:oxygen-independent coproporphyrinogen-3 oxidase|uniref:Heme chaperone HemW n=1 Tax=Vreelandella titanicae BH1 TaxID=1204738 RepID=L9UFB9_9GAMM|nr:MULTISPECIES: radical SAM family heme chaperone HemW [Halomonas]ELY22908.1 Putative oxygen-independent coproporphyrinogen III oxidase [Halomonas titanicae BH1]KIN17117.1 oxidase [Halomonas sp. KHS3]MCE7517953.1 radical SAM family heme chaperone HemW [Halomonas titanicae]NVE89318.1 radical SAM family heme chaperone HemW [Halomonas titanicae]